MVNNIIKVMQRIVGLMYRLKRTGKGESQCLKLSRIWSLNFVAEIIVGYNGFAFRYYCKVVICNLVRFKL